MNTHLNAAAKAKNDEFYTEYKDIEQELKHYIEYNAEVFKGKVILCPCDDWEFSNFTKYFIDNFERLQIKKLISTCIAKHPEAQIGFGESYDEQELHGKVLIKTRDKEYTEVLKGNGDYRSEEVGRYREQADMIITNPPFSILRDFITWIGDKEFLIVAPVGALSYLSVFEAITESEYHIGYESISEFITPVGSAIQVGAIWLTTLEPVPYYPPLELTAQYKGNEDKYPFYDNYNAINVDRVADIPYDYDGVMGVPCTFLMKWNKEQFKIVKFRYGDDNKDLAYCYNGGGQRSGTQLLQKNTNTQILGAAYKKYPKEQYQINRDGSIQIVHKLNDGIPCFRYDSKPDTVCYITGDNKYYIRAYSRIFIKRKVR